MSDKFDDLHNGSIDFASSTAIIIDCCGHTPGLFRNGHHAHAGEFFVSNSCIIRSEHLHMFSECSIFDSGS